MMVEAAEPDEYGEIYALVGRAFKNPRLEVTMVQATINENPNFRKGDLRIVKHDGKIVSMMMVIRKSLRIGSSVVNGAIVAPVATLPDYEKRGYCSAVMRNAVEYMKSEGLDITILWGHPWLYPHYGYSPSMLSTQLVIKPKVGAITEERKFRFRPFQEIDLEQMTRIYDENTGKKALSEVRSSMIWEWKTRNSAVLEVLTDDRDEIVGYLALGTDWGHLSAVEIGVLNDEACEAILSRLIEIAAHKNLNEFYCLVHPEHPFACFAFWHGGEIRIQSGGGAGMARILNLASILEKMEKEFEYRLRYSEFHNLDCSFKISTEEASVVMEIERGEVSISSEGKGNFELDIPLSCLNPLITGCKSIADLIKDPYIRVKGGEHMIRLLEVLFPTGYPSGGALPLVWE